MQVFPRNPKDLLQETSDDITPDTGTNYPCTQQELNASGGANRRTAWDAFKVKNNTKWFAYPNNGPFVDARKAACEIFDHNDQKRIPSAAEKEAISRLITGFKNAGREYWGPDLAIKAFCDLDKVFFCGRLKGHVCLTWKPDSSFKSELYASTLNLGAGKCVIQLNADLHFSFPFVALIFNQMFDTLLHEMW